MPKYNQKGFVAFFIAILVLVIVFGIVLSISFLTLSQQKISGNIIKSSQAYYVAEAGIEDALLRVFSPTLNYSTSYALSVGTGIATISIYEVSGDLTIEATGDTNQRIRKIKVDAIISQTEASFFYGIQAGVGGLTMDGNSMILGNVYSDGPVSGASNAKIEGDIYSAGPAGSISNLDIEKSEPGAEDGNAHAHILSDLDVENGAYYQVENNVDAAIYYPGSPDPESEDLPIPESKITEWKNDAADGGTIDDYFLGGNDEDSLGSIKIQGNMEVTSNAIFTVTGIIWVTGDITFDSNAVIKLDDGYGSNSGVIIADGKIQIGSNNEILGAGEGSFLMLLSTNNSLNPSSPAIEASSNIDACILYTNDGMIVLNSNARLKEVTGYAIHLDSNAQVTYETGLADLRFTSGPSGGWKVVGWKEIE